MIKILQLSDLHIVNDANGLNLTNALLQMAEKTFKPLPKGKKLLVITGDFHFYYEDNYNTTIDFIKKIVKAMGIELKKDVFLIPGNHDVSPAKDKMERMNQENAVFRVNYDISLLQDDLYIELLINRFNAYSNFCRQLGIYSEDELPGAVHVRTWRRKLNILHLNTCLVADGSKDDQLIDTKSVNMLTKKGRLPYIAIGHNSFFDLHEDVKVSLSAKFFSLNVRAYLCGDRHKTETDRYQQHIILQSGYGDRKAIPNIVCCKSSTDVKDDYSDVGCMIHVWDEESGNVGLNTLRWYANIDQSKFEINNAPDVYSLSNSIGVSEASSAKFVDNQPDIDPCVLENYRQYIRRHCSEIELNGLPTQDTDAARKYELSKLFVPLRFKVRDESFDDKIFDDVNDEILHLGSDSLKKIIENRRIGKEIFLYLMPDVELSHFIPKDGNFKYLVLAAPGGGKTTLLKRIASAYCFPDEYLADSALTERELFPIWIRCRDIQDKEYSIWKAIKEIPGLGEWSPNGETVDPFIKLVGHHIEKGTALLLIDGLDEIGSDQGRQSFVEHLSGFIGHNPKVNVIITSREKGFSIVSNNLFHDFLTFRVDDLDNGEIKKLCNNWFTLVYGNDEKIRSDADKLVNRILKHERIKRLAKNPLMLTTLLLVDRRTGSLPTKRAGLYYEATNVLLERWNAEYHDKGKIDLDEAKYQLAYVAFEMTQHYEKYRNRICKSDLIKLLRKVREECSNLVSGNIGSIDDVINVVERRSALLVQTGVERMEDGHTEPIYEFQHLTFQEYLAAFAVSSNCYPGVKPLTKKGSVLEQSILQANMKEVILLCATMDSECAVNLSQAIENMIDIITKSSDRDRLCEILLSFVADEAPLSRDDIQVILESCQKYGFRQSFVELLRQIVSGKYMDNLQSFFNQYDTDNNDGYDCYSSLILILLGEIDDPYKYFIDNRFSTDDMTRAKAFSLLTNVFFLDSKKLSSLDDENKREIKESAINVLSDSNLRVAEAAFELLYMGSFINSIEDLLKYVDRLVEYICRYNSVPRIIRIDDIKSDNEFREITVNNHLTGDAMTYIIKVIVENNAPSRYDYYEHLTLLFTAAVSSNQNNMIQKLFSVIYQERTKILPEIANNTVEKRCVHLLERLICSCPSSTTEAKDAIKEYREKIENNYMAND